MRCRQVETRLWGGGREVPESNGIVKRAGEEGIRGRVEGQGGDGSGVAFEVAQVLEVVGGEVADGFVVFGAGVEYRLRVMGEARQMGAVLFRQQFFHMFAFFGVIQLERVVVACSHEKFACVVKVE